MYSASRSVYSSLVPDCSVLERFASPLRSTNIISLLKKLFQSSSATEQRSRKSKLPSTLPASPALSRLPGSPNAEVTNKEKETKGKKQAQQGEVDEVVEREEEEQLHHAKQDKQSPCQPPGDGMREVERCAQARALFDQQAGVVAVDVKNTGDPPLVVVAIAGVRWHWLRRRRMHCRILLLGNNAHYSI